MAYFFEITQFAVVSLLIAPLGEIAVASHQIVFAISSMTFVIPLSLSIATSIRVSYLLGERQTKLARYSSYISLSLAFLLSLIIFTLLMRFDHYFIRCFTSNTTIIGFAIQLTFLMAIYQCSDYIQVVSASVLRVYKDTKMIFIITFISYWLVGLPIGYYMLALTNAFIPAMGPAGFWVGFICGLSTSAILMLSRMCWIQKQSDVYILLKTA